MNRLVLMWNCRLALIFSSAFAGSLDMQGPLFLQEPPHRLEFSNSSGGRIMCAGHGSPPPQVEWVVAAAGAAAGSADPATPVPGLRAHLNNGTLLFPPFPADRFRHDIHASTYRCRLKSALGSIVSREVHVRAVVKQKYDVQVYDEYVIAGNTAVLRCQVPSYVADYVLVTSWVQDAAVNIYPNTDIGGKYAVLANGDLYISNAGPSDGYKSYICRTLHRLTEENFT